jgi:N-acetylmuramoyl-L-alanine amidase
VIEVVKIRAAQADSRSTTLRATGLRATGLRTTELRGARLLSLVVLAGLGLTGCAAAAGAGAPPAKPSTAAGSAAPRATSRPSATAAASQPGTAAATKPLAGKIVGIDPGHNGLNYTDPAYLNRQIWNGREDENCNTTGTQTASGYTEAQFNWNVASYLRKMLRKQGARVVLTRKNNHGIGPCVNTRSFVLNKAHANVAIDIHADGGPSWGRGFTVLEPVADGPNSKVIKPSLRFGSFVHQALVDDTPMRPANYYGHNGYIFRDDLAGLNLTTVPKVLIECGNMPNSADAALLTSASVQRRIAKALDAAIVRFLLGRWPPGTAS